MAGRLWSGWRGRGSLETSGFAQGKWGRSGFAGLRMRNRGRSLRPCVLAILQSLPRLTLPHLTWCRKAIWPQPGRAADDASSAYVSFWAPWGAESVRTVVYSDIIFCGRGVGRVWGCSSGWRPSLCSPGWCKLRLCLSRPQSWGYRHAPCARGGYFNRSFREIADIPSFLGISNCT